MSDEYDDMCNFYRSIPSIDRHLNFGVYLGTIGTQIAKDLDKLEGSLTKGSKEYKYLKNKVLNLPRYDSLLKEKLSHKENYYLVGAYWKGSKPTDQTNSFIEKYIWENGYDDKFFDEVKAVPEGSKIAIKSAFTRNKTQSVMAIKARGTVIKNHDDGKRLGVNWEKDFHPFEVDFFRWLLGYHK